MGTMKEAFKKNPAFGTFCIHNAIRNAGMTLKELSEQYHMSMEEIKKLNNKRLPYEK